MRKLTMFSGKDYELHDDEAQVVKRMWDEDPNRPINLRCGITINPKGIESIGFLEGRKIGKFLPPVKLNLTDEQRKANMKRFRDIKNNALKK